MNKNNWLSMISLAIIVPAINTSVNAAELIPLLHVDSEVAQSKQELETAIDPTVMEVEKAEMQSALKVPERVVLNAAQQVAIKAVAIAKAQLASASREIQITNRKQETSRITQSVKETVTIEKPHSEKQELQKAAVQKEAKLALEDVDARFKEAKKSGASENEIKALQEERKRKRERYNYYCNEEYRRNKLAKQKAAFQHKKRKLEEMG